MTDQQRSFLCIGTPLHRAILPICSRRFSPCLSGGGFFGIQPFIQLPRCRFLQAWQDVRIDIVGDPHCGVAKPIRDNLGVDPLAQHETMSVAQVVESAGAKIRSPV